MKKHFSRFVAKHITKGDLLVEFPDGTSSSFGDKSGKRVKIRFETKGALRAVVTNPELALGEEFMSGNLTICEGELYDFLELVFSNIGAARVSGLPKVLKAILQIKKGLRPRNDLVASRKNVAHHYDLSGDLYRLFLDRDSQYSCAYFENPEASLEEAQSAKKRRLAAKLLLNKGDKVLDIGSGWGGLGLYLANEFGAEVTGVTLSEEQHAVSNKRAKEMALEDQARFLLKDYRKLRGRFDRIVSVGMFEHVGVEAYDEFFNRVHDLLEDDGVMVLHSIGQSDGPSSTNPWILKYIFPGGYIPSLSEVLPAIERAGLVVCDIEILRLHYAETLRHWRERFMQRRDEAVALYDERFARMWEFYLASSETGFRYQNMMVFQIQLARKQTVVPLPRTYIAQAEAGLRSPAAAPVAAE